jgi:hypothetical protein
MMSDLNKFDSDEWVAQGPALRLDCWSLLSVYSAPRVFETVKGIALERPITVADVRGLIQQIG